MKTCPLYLNSARVDELWNALHSETESRVLLREWVEEQQQALDDHDLTVEAANNNYAVPSNDEIEVDLDPPLSIVEEEGVTTAVWVNAWVWVPIEGAE